MRCDRRVVIPYVTTEDTCKSNFNQIHAAGENCAVRKIGERDIQPPAREVAEK